MKTTIAIILLLMFLACKNEPKTSRYFEGYVDYKIEAISLDNRYETKEYVKRGGNSMRCYFKNGNYMREYFDSNNITTKKYLYQTATNRFVYILSQALYYGFEEPDEGEISSKTKDWKIIDSNFAKKILGINCVGFSGSYKTVEKKPSTIILTYYYANTLPFDYSNFKRSSNPYIHYFSNRFPFIALYFIEEDVDKTKTSYTAIKIVSTTLSDTLFTVPNDKPLIHL